MSKLFTAIFAALITGSTALPVICKAQSNLTQFVDPFIGTENGVMYFLALLFLLEW